MQPRDVLIGLSALIVAFGAAVVATLLRRLRGDGAGLESALRVFHLGVGVQCLHFTEEFVTRLYVRLPELLGLPPYPAEAFVAFNLAWIAIWVWCGVALRAGADNAFLVPVWFFAIAMTANGALHPLLALATGGYFPGLWTSPAAGVAGYVLLGRLLKATRPAAESSPGG